MTCTEKHMDREKMRKQAKILKDKKLARIAQLGKQLRPQVESGVVKHQVPVKQVKKVQQFTAPPAPAPVSPQRMVIPKSQQTHRQDMQQQSVNSKKVVRRQKGCSGCGRKIAK